MRKIYIPAYIIEWKDVKIALVFLGMALVWVGTAIWWVISHIGLLFVGIFKGIGAIFTATKNYNEDDAEEEPEPEETPAPSSNGAKKPFDLFDQEL